MLIPSSCRSREGGNLVAFDKTTLGSRLRGNDVTIFVEIFPQFEVPRHVPKAEIGK